MPAQLDAQAQANDPSLRPARRRLLLLLKLGVTAAAFGFLLTAIDVGSALRAMLRVPVQNLALAVGAVYLGTCLAALRWRVVLGSCGAARIPPLPRLLRLMLITLFYNTLPGGMGGEIVRGYATSDAFQHNGLTRAIGVSLLDRLFGVAGLLVVTSVAFAWKPLPGVGGVFAFGGAGAAAIALAVVTLAVAPRLGRALPGPFARVAAQLPELSAPLGILPALALSVGTQSCAVLMGYAVLEPLAPETMTAGIAFVVVPLATAAAYFPFTIAGAGAREAVLVVLLSFVGVPQDVALAGGLLMLACMLLVAASGGLVNLVTPLRTDRGA